MTDFNPEYVKNLPDAYQKTEDSNNFKILEIERYAIDELNGDVTDVFNMVDIDRAKGKTLDLYGDMASQARGKATDEQYLYMVKAKIARNLAGGSYADITGALCRTLSCTPDQIHIEESETPATVDVTTLPLPVILNAGFTTAQTMLLIKAMLPAGINIHMFVFDGTFTFSESSGEYDAEQGFGDDNQMVGGYFGFLAGGEEEIELPI